jgi:hypothetical protein
MVMYGVENSIPSHGYGGALSVSAIHREFQCRLTVHAIRNLDANELVESDTKYFFGTSSAATSAVD